MKKSTEKNLLGLLLLKSAILAGWYAYGKYLAKNANESSENSVNKTNEKPLQKEQDTEAKKEVNLNTVKPVVKSTPVKKVAVKKLIPKVVKKTPALLPIKEKKAKKELMKRKPKAI